MDFEEQDIGGMKKMGRMANYMHKKFVYNMDRIRYLNIQGNQVMYFLDNPFYSDLQMGGELVSVFIVKRPASVQEAVRICGYKSIESIVSTSFLLMQQGIIEVENDYMSKDIEGEEIISGIESNVLDVQKKCKSIIDDVREEKVSILPYGGEDLFNIHFMRKNIFAFKRDYYVCVAKGALCVVRNEKAGVCLFEFLSLPMCGWRESLREFIKKCFKENEFCKQIRIELWDDNRLMREYLEKQDDFRMYLCAFESGKIRYGYQMMRPEYDD